MFQVCFSVLLMGLYSRVKRSASEYDGFILLLKKRDEFTIHESFKYQLKYSARCYDKRYSENKAQESVSSLECDVNAVQAGV